MSNKFKNNGINFSIQHAHSVNIDDLTEAIDIYNKCVDRESETKPNEIIEQIEMKTQQKRKMFFYVLYSNNEVAGFAEYAYLPNSEVLMIDYLCTSKRHPMFFYNYYHLILIDIEEHLKRKRKFISYIVTELSLKKDKNKYFSDEDSNFFRKVLSLENFTVLKFPYYQPYLRNFEVVEFPEFNLSIKSVSQTTRSLNIDSKFYLQLVKEIYMEHYTPWLKKYATASANVEETLEKKVEQIRESIPKKDINTLEIGAISCSLLEQNKCKHVKWDAITKSDLQKQKIKLSLIIIFWFILSGISFLLCFFQKKFDIEPYITAIAFMFTFISGLLSIFKK